MIKDNFYYILKNRLDFAKDYLKDTSDYLRCLNFQKEVRREFYKDKPLLYLFVSFFNLPTNLINYLKYLQSIFYYSKATNEIEVLKKELKKYDSKFQ
tara:strand:+ start:248 stop:538 length:291 start_codon:yes stop_codon:yes gene_type:complete